MNIQGEARPQAQCALRPTVHRFLFTTLLRGLAHAAARRWIETAALAGGRMAASTYGGVARGETRYTLLDRVGGRRLAIDLLGRASYADRIDAICGDTGAGLSSANRRGRKSAQSGGS
jgi:hypothetical protein